MTRGSLVGGMFSLHYGVELQGDLPNPRTEPKSPALQTDILPTEPQGKSTEKMIFKFTKTYKIPFDLFILNFPPIASYFTYPTTH